MIVEDRVVLDPLGRLREPRPRRAELDQLGDAVVSLIVGIRRLVVAPAAHGDRAGDDVGPEAVVVILVIGGDVDRPIDHEGGPLEIVACSPRIDVACDADERVGPLDARELDELGAENWAWVRRGGRESRGAAELEHHRVAARRGKRLDEVGVARIQRIEPEGVQLRVGLDPLPERKAEAIGTDRVDRREREVLLDSHLSGAESAERARELPAAGIHVAQDAIRVAIEPHHLSSLVAMCGIGVRLREADAAPPRVGAGDVAGRPRGRESPRGFLAVFDQLVADLEDAVAGEAVGRFHGDHGGGADLRDRLEIGG